MRSASPLPATADGSDAAPQRYRVVPIPDVSVCSKLRIQMLAYSITSSARASKDGGVVIPSALAVLTLITSSVFETCCTVRSDGLSPFNTRLA